LLQAIKEARTVTTATDLRARGMSPLLLDLPTVRYLLGGVSRGHVDNLRRSGQLKSVKSGNRVLFIRSDVERYVEQLAQHPA
jgi:excisionase family DNA binding protein